MGYLLLLAGTAVFFGTQGFYIGSIKEKRPQENAIIVAGISAVAGAAALVAMLVLGG